MWSRTCTGSRTRVSSGSSCTTRSTASKVFGRWNDAALRTTAVLARHKAEQAFELLRGTAALASHRRWLSLLSMMAQTALADSLLYSGTAQLTEYADDAPALRELLAVSRAAEPPVLSRCR